MVQQPLVGQGHSIEASRSFLDTSQSVGLLWTSDQPDAEASTWQHITLTTDRHPYSRRDSNLQSQQAAHRALDRAVTGVDSGAVYVN
jgi:CTP:molybdopterin cytidylyltransferase MocA